MTVDRLGMLSYGVATGRGFWYVGTVGIGASVVATGTGISAGTQFYPAGGYTA